MLIARGHIVPEKDAHLGMPVFCPAFTSLEPQYFHWSPNILSFICPVIGQISLLYL